MFGEYISKNEILIVVLASFLVGLYKLMDYIIKKKQDARDVIKQEYDQTLLGVYSANLHEKIASAILLRRFLLSNTYAGRGRKKSYYEDTIDVIVSMLRIERCSPFQKTLADSLAWANDMSQQDLQFVNLQNTSIKPPKNVTHTTIDISSADLFMADLSYATLKNIKAHQTYFINTILNKCTFRDSDLSGAVFRNADLSEVRFLNTRLDGANFNGAINIPEKILLMLNAEGIYDGRERSEPEYKDKCRRKKLFLSCSNVLSPRQSEFIDSLIKWLTDRGIDVDRLTRDSYRNSGQIGIIRHRIAQSDGVIIIGMKYVLIGNGVFRPGTCEKKELNNTWLSTPWNCIEAGLAGALGIPLLLLHDSDINSGIFDTSINDNNISHIELEIPNEVFKQKLGTWLQSIVHS